MRKGLVSIILVIIFCCTSAWADMAVTVYNQNLALVKDQRSLEFEKGRFEYSLTNVPSQIDPTSVHFKLLNNQDRALLLEQNYRYDLVGFGKIMEKYLDKKIDMIHEDGTVYSGTLLAYDGKSVSLLKSDGSLEVIQTTKLTKFDFPKLPEGLITKPTLVWLFDSDLTGKQESEISYMTHGMTWHTEYVGVLSDDEKSLDLAAWVSVENNSGASFDQAKLKLVAGDVNVVKPAPQPMYRTGAVAEMDFVGRGKAGFEEKAFFEYHLYTLPRKTSLANNEVKQIALFEPVVADIEKVYNFDGNKKIRVNVELTNSENNGLGLPLPAGKVRMMKRDTDGAIEFIGEDMIDHTPRDEKLKLFLGNAFDLVGERIVMDSRKISKTIQEEDIEITLKNRKEDESVEIIVTEGVSWRSWEIMKTNYEYEKKDARTIEFKIPVKAGKEVKLKYTRRLTR
jgi:hypothetical protein